MNERTELKALLRKLEECDKILEDCEAGSLYLKEIRTVRMSLLGLISFVDAEKARVRDGDW